MLNDEEVKFLADDMVGKLAKWLRILGYDVRYYHSIDDEKLISTANSERRILLTRDSKIADPGRVRQCVFLESDDYRAQLRRVLTLFALKPGRDKIFSRCLICNEKLVEIDRERAKGKVPPFVFETRERFIACEKCNKIYWKGTHNERVEEVLKDILGEDG